MNILMDLTDDEIKQLREKLNTKPVDESLIIKFEQAIDKGIDGLFNWIEIPEDKKDIPIDVTFGKFRGFHFKDATHYFKHIEVGE